MTTKEAGRKGGQANTKAQAEARLENLAKGRAARWRGKRGAGKASKAAVPAPSRRSCKRCRRKFFGDKAICAGCEERQRRRERGLCLAVLHHGPGHQSHTYCEQREAKHRMHRGRKLHSAEYGSFRQRAEWYGKKKFTGYFDEPPAGAGW